MIVEAEFLVQLIQQYSVLAVIVGMVIEEVFVPIPSPIIPMAAGAIIIETQSLLPALLQILLIITLPASIASVISSYFVYGIAYYGGKPVIQRYGRWLDLSWDEIQDFEQHFDSGQEKYYVALFRAVPIVPLSLVSGAAGLFRMNWKEYGVWSFIGMIPRNFILAFIGWSFRDQFIELASHIDKASTAVALGFAGLFLIFIVYRKVNKLRRKLVKKV